MQAVTRKRLLTGGLAILGLAAAAAGGGYAWLITPPPMPETAEEAVHILSSPRFRRLPESRKPPYRAEARRLLEQMPAEARRKLRQTMRDDPEARQAMRQMMRDRLLQTAVAFAQADRAERLALLDEQLDRMASWRNRGRRNGAARAEGRSDRRESSGEAEQARRRAAFRDRIESHLEEGNPQVGALMGEYFRALRMRREQRETEGARPASPDREHGGS